MLLVTGATGFVGRRMVARLSSKGWRLRCLVRHTSRVEALRPYPVELAYGDVTDLPSLEEATRGVATAIHLAAIIREKGKATYERVNVQGTQNLLQACLDSGVKKFLYMSNIGARPDPRFPFLHSKERGEQGVMQSGMRYIILRSSVMFGEGDGFVRNLAGLVKTSPVVPILGMGDTRFQLISVDEVVRCLELALEREMWGQAFSLGGPEHLTYEQIVDLVIRALRKRRWKFHIPLFLIRPGVKVMEKILPNPPVSSQQLKMLSFDNITDLDSVERAFGFKPTPLRLGLGYISRA